MLDESDQEYQRLPAESSVKGKQQNSLRGLAGGGGGGLMFVGTDGCSSHLWEGFHRNMVIMWADNVPYTEGDLLRVVQKIQTV